MKELEVTVTVRNNRLKARRRALGLNQMDMASAIGVPLVRYMHLETLRELPMVDEQWTAVALKIADYFEADPWELFPEAVQSVMNPTVVRELDGAEVLPLLAAPRSELLALPPDATYNLKERNEKIDRVLASLPAIDAEIIRRRFGLDGDPETLKSISASFGYAEGGEWARQREARALRMLRHPSRARQLCMFAEGLRDPERRCRSGAEAGAGPVSEDDL